MGEFKKGDFVRRTSGSSFYTSAGRHEAGFVGQVSYVIFRGGTNDIIFTNGHEGIAENYEPWQPRVGERVRVTITANNQWAGDGEVTEIRNFIFIVSMKTGQFAGKPGGFYVRDLEPILTTTTAQHHHHRRPHRKRPAQAILNSACPHFHRISRNGSQAASGEVQRQAVRRVHADYDT